ncbi:hypothetical protein [Flavobacterium sp. NRK1]|uniref:hypothetical protein n=1 Tax=Flavobacterium sp. NRK1 TaxID=2954929 RepID=UPI0020922D09|nr:hypothetical protein [Flavobacterium sp. NRK1]MCO6147390.1 hypothetical protein [Flavobacterium sp. NRK1]
MKYIYITISILFAHASFAQSGINEEDIKAFKDKSPFKGGLSKTKVPLDYSIQKESKVNVDTLEDNPFREQLNSWDRVHSTSEAQTLNDNDIPYQAGEDNTPLLNSYSKQNSTDWSGIIITSLLLVMLLLAGIFL